MNNGLTMEKEKIHILAYMKDAPLSVINQIMKVSMGAMLIHKKNATEEELDANVEYHSLMYMRLSAVDLVQVEPSRLIGYCIHPLQSEDRLGNKAIDFPIAMAFGDKDWFGSEGADEIIRNNKHFKSGQSQLFKIENCRHFMNYDQPEEMCRLMIGFFEGTVRGNFQLKPRLEVARRKRVPKL